MRLGDEGTASLDSALVLKVRSVERVGVKR